MRSLNPFVLALVTAPLISAGPVLGCGSFELSESQLDVITAGGIVVDAVATADVLATDAGLAVTSTETSATQTQGIGEAASIASGDLLASSTTGVIGGIDGGASGPDLLVVTGGTATALGSESTTEVQSRVLVRDGRIVDIGVAGSVSAATGVLTDANAFADGDASGDIVILHQRAGTRGGPNSDTAFARVVVISITPPQH